jgi:hypothetical protein
VVDPVVWTALLGRISAQSVFGLFISFRSIRLPQRTDKTDRCKPHPGCSRQEENVRLRDLLVLQGGQGHLGFELSTVVLAFLAHRRSSFRGLIQSSPHFEDHPASHEFSTNFIKAMVSFLFPESLHPKT